MVPSSTKEAKLQYILYIVSWPPLDDDYNWLIGISCVLYQFAILVPRCYQFAYCPFLSVCLYRHLVSILKGRGIWNRIAVVWCPDAVLVDACMPGVGLVILHPGYQAKHTVGYQRFSTPRPQPGNHSPMTPAVPPMWLLKYPSTLIYI